MCLPWRVRLLTIDSVCPPAARNGFTVVRMFAFPVQEGFNLQVSRLLAHAALAAFVCHVVNEKLAQQFLFN